MSISTRLLSTYSADLFGMCSALYELGGLIIMHDASGCNSTYCTHDEPRWFDMDSMIYISALTEEDVIMGQEDRLIDDAVSAVKAARNQGRPPRFVAIGGSPMPFMIGCDIEGAARAIHERTGLPALGLECGGIKDYTIGAGAALSWLVDAFCIKTVPPDERDEMKKAIASSQATHKGAYINILGVTPLDYSTNGNAQSFVNFFQSRGMNVISSWAMGSSLDEIAHAGLADVNVVVSAAGLPAAKRLMQVYGTRYEIGITMDSNAMDEVFADAAEADTSYQDESGYTLIIGEAVFAHSLRRYLEDERGFERVRILCPLIETCGLLKETDLHTSDEGKIIDAIRGARMVIADPIYRRALADGSKTQFISFPHEAYSGRMYRDNIPIFVSSEG